MNEVHGGLAEPQKERPPQPVLPQLPNVLQDGLVQLLYVTVLLQTRQVLIQLLLQRDRDVHGDVVAVSGAKAWPTEANGVLQLDRLREGQVGMELR